MCDEAIVGSTYTTKLLLSKANAWVTPTVAAGDFVRKINGGTVANLTNTPTVSDWEVTITLAAAETTSAGDNGLITIYGRDPDGTWDDIGLVVRCRDKAISRFTIADLFAYATEGSATFVQMIRVMYAALANLSTGGKTTNPRFRDLANSKDRISATVDSNGNRTAVVVDGS